MRHALILTSVLASLTAGTAVAQERPGQDAGLRYLGWAGRSTDTAPRGPQSSTSADGLRRPAAVIPHAGTGAPPLTRASATATQPRTPDRIQRSGLTPATAWLHPIAATPTPAYAPAYVQAEAQPEYTADYLPDPVRPAPTRPQQAQPQQVQSQPVQQRPEPVRVEAATVQSRPVQSQVVQPQQPIQQQPAQPGYEIPAYDPADPMAPRADAPVFRMQQQPAQQQPVAQQQLAPAQIAPQTQQLAQQQPQQQAQQAAPAQAGPSQTARYYSVHRQYGRQPDAVLMPVQGNVDVLQLSEAPTSADLSEPQAGPNLMRTADGKLVPVPDQDTP